MSNVEVIQDEVTTETFDLVVTEKSVGSLETNISALESLVEKRLEDYRPENYNGDADLARKDRAELNKAKEKISRARKDLIAELMKPYTNFEDRCKALEKKIDLASSKLDEIVKVKEQEEKDNKKKKIELIWETKNFDLFPLEKIFNPKWLNKTYKESDIIAEMDQVISKTYKDLKTIESFSDIADVLKAHYLMCLEIGDTLDYGEELKKKNEIAQKEKAEREQREHEQKIRQQEKENYTEQKEIKKAEAVSDLANLALQAAGNEVPEELRKEFVVTIRCYDRELVALKNAMNQIGIEFEVKELTF
jgi:hypothetical protein